MLDKIARYKQTRNTPEMTQQKEEAIQKALKTLKNTKIQVRCHRKRVESIKLPIECRDRENRLLEIKIADEDEQYLEKSEISVVYKSSSVSLDNGQHLPTFRSKELIELQPERSEVLVL
jgi:hypothetical protein